MTVVQVVMTTGLAWGEEATAAVTNICASYVGYVCNCCGMLPPI